MDSIKPVAEIKCGRLQWHIPAPDYVLAEKFLNNETHPLFDQAALDAAVAAARATERERCAKVCVDVAAEAVKKYQDSTAPVPQPYANNRLMHVGWSAADAIRKG